MTNERGFFEKKQRWIPKQEAQLQENPLQGSTICLERVEPKWNNAFWPDVENKYFHVVQ